MKYSIQCDVCLKNIGFPICDECGFDNTYQMHDSSLLEELRAYVEFDESSIDELCELFGISEQLARQILEEIEYEQYGMEITDVL